MYPDECANTCWSCVHISYIPRSDTYYCSEDGARVEPNYGACKDYEEDKWDGQ